MGVCWEVFRRRNSPGHRPSGVLDLQYGSLVDSIDSPLTPPAGHLGRACALPMPAVELWAVHFSIIFSLRFWTRFWTRLGSVLGSSWAPLGTLLGAQIGSSWAKNAS